MVREQTREGETRYYSEAEKAGRLSAGVLERIRPLMVLDSQLATYAVPDSERAAIQGATGILGDKSGRRTVEVDEVDDIAPAPKTRKARTKAPEKDEAVTRAAATGDMSEALTRAAGAKEEIVVSAPEPQKAKPAPKPSAPPAAPKKGMSLLELAKARKEAAA
jgi:hypothetical protein